MWHEYIHRKILSPDLLSTKSFDEIMEVAGKRFNPKPSSIVQHFWFNSQIRKEGESVAEFIAQLRQLSEHYQFGNTLSDMLRDRIVCGINDQCIQRCLLAESDLTLGKQWNYCSQWNQQIRMPIPLRPEPQVKLINLCYRCKIREEKDVPQVLLSKTMEELIKTVTQLVTDAMANT